MIEISIEASKNMAANFQKNRFFQVVVPSPRPPLKFDHVPFFIRQLLSRNKVLHISTHYENAIGSASLLPKNGTKFHKLLQTMISYH